MKKKLVTALLAMSFIAASSVQVFASENDLLDEILAKEAEKQQIYEDRIEEIEGDGIEGDKADIHTTQVTCYVEAGQPTCTGSYRMDGIIAAQPENVGKVAQVYKVAEDGSVGEFLGYFEVADTGYGAPSGYGKSRYKGRRSAGTIELGITVDFRKPNMGEARRFMKTTYTGGGTTGSQVYIVMEDGEG